MVTRWWDRSREGDIELGTSVSAAMCLLDGIGSGLTHSSFVEEVRF